MTHKVVCSNHGHDSSSNVLSPWARLLTHIVPPHPGKKKKKKERKKDKERKEKKRKEKKRKEKKRKEKKKEMGTGKLSWWEGKTDSFVQEE